MASNPVSRRALLRSGAAAALAGPVLGATARAQGGDRPAGDPWQGLKIGVASYTFRKLPLEGCIAGIKRVDLNLVSIKDFHLPLKSSAEERRTAAKKFRDAGITPLSCGVINMPDSEGAVRDAFQYARDAGIPTIVAAPDPAALPIIDRMVKEFDIRVAIHNHGPGDMKFPSPFDVWNAVQSLDRRIGLCIDVGHTQRIGIDPVEAIRKTRTRLYDMHLKDVTKAAADGKSTEQGRGVIDTKGILQALLDIHFPYLVSYEYEKDADDPLPGLSESVGYTKGVLLSLRPSSAGSRVEKG